MAQNYTKMWDAFLGGEYEGYDASKDYLEQTKDFYKTVLAPAFDLPGFGETDLAGAYAQFSEVDFETAERDFRSAIGDPYGTDDPFSWEKVSRYNTGDPAGVGRLQDLLEDQLYGQGKFLGGEAGADYGTATSKGVEAYSTGMRGESEALTYGGLTSGVSLASGTSGATLRSGEGTAVAEDVLIEAYKKAKTLGSSYREGSELIERTLEGDLDTALTTYLEAIDEEKSRWFSSILGNVETFKTLEMGDTATFSTMTDVQLKEHMDIEGVEGGHYEQWGCGYGQTWDPAITDADGETVGGCVDTKGTAGYEAEVAGYQFRDDEKGACGIGMIFQDGECKLIEELEGLAEDNSGLLCESERIDACGVCNGDGSTCSEDCAGVPNGDAEEDVCGECNGSETNPDNCWDDWGGGEPWAGDDLDLDDDTDPLEDDYPVPPEDMILEGQGGHIDCDAANASGSGGGGGQTFGSSSCWCSGNACPDGKLCGQNGVCYTPTGGGGDGEGGSFWNPKTGQWVGACPPGTTAKENHICIPSVTR